MNTKKYLTKIEKKIKKLKAKKIKKLKITNKKKEFENVLQPPRGKLRKLYFL